MTGFVKIRQIAEAALIVCGLLAGASDAAGQGNESELIGVSNAWIDAEVQRDQAALERLLDERFLATFSSGKTIDRATFIAWIMKSEIQPFEVLNEVVDIHGDTALVIATTTDHSVKFTWVAVRKEGQWKVISETFSRIAAAE